MAAINPLHSNYHREGKRSPFFTSTDLRQMRDLGISREQVFAQLDTFRRSSFHVHLSRPCKIQDGVRQLSAEAVLRCLQLHERAALKGRFTKFVPASGAATRMFQSLLEIFYMPQCRYSDELYMMAEGGDSAACDFFSFLEGIERFPFVSDLKEALEYHELDMSDLLNKCRYRTILDHLLWYDGLNYAALPKGLLKFHSYPDGSRTAFEEHLIEAVPYIADADGECNLHFTVSAAHEKAFAKLLDKIRSQCENRYHARLNISFSHQKLSTNTIAVDMNNRLFRDRHGYLHFRPGGHGALLDNLEKLEGDLVYIRNIDNVAPDRQKVLVAFWKKVLGGYLVEVQGAVHGFVRRLKSELSMGLIEVATNYAHETLSIELPMRFRNWPLGRRHEWLLKKLNRPIRVCGVVRNLGQPGGAPFWVEKKGEISIQIIEQSQVNFESTQQRKIWRSSTHFNPVDIVCGLKDYRGNSFDLGKYVDREAVFVTKKSKYGRELKALELPGLWNGAMADWITVIVEVPAETFNPVKTVLDLLKPEHQG